MNSFINQGRCRVCGKMLCCSNHQKEHERLEHKEYAYLLDKLPILCRRCCRSIRSVHDLHAHCHPFMDQRLMNGNFSDAVLFSYKPNRKRALNQVKKLNDDIQFITFAANERKKLVPVYKFKRTDIRKVISDTGKGQQTLVIEVNHVGLLVDSSKHPIFSPQLNISYKMLMKSIIESSTPLNEDEKENVSPALKGNSIKSESVYKSPEFSVMYKSPEVFHSPAIVISAKKNTPPGIISNFSKRMSKKVFRNRKVTFELIKTTESEGNFTIYSTPTATMEVIEEANEQGEIDLTIPSSPPRCLLLKIVKRMRNVINSIPRTISTAWDWSNQKFKNSKSNDDYEIRSPLKKRPKYETANSLIRKPITSHWVDMSVNSLFREPLPNYVHRFRNTEEN